MDIENYAKNKIDRALRLSENFEEMDEPQLRSVFDHLIHALQIMPNNKQEKYEIYTGLRNLMNMKIERCGAIFKAYSWKESMRIDKNDLQKLIWTVNSLVY